jgi:urease accessory protein
MATGTAMTIEATQLLLLLNWMSPAFPIGSFSYSHGLEWAIEERILTSASDLKDWIEKLVTCGSGWNDAVIFAQCWEGELEALNELALALASSQERHLETVQLGRAFRSAVSAWQVSGIPDCKDLAYPVAAGTACHAMGIDKHHALLAALQGFSNALISVAVKLIPLGQTQGLAVARDLMPVIATTAARAATATLDDLGSMTLAADIAAMKHETLPTRIFRT